MLSALRRFIASIRLYWVVLFGRRKPAIDFAHYGPDGVGYLRPPSWTRAGAIDEGQWDIVKRQFRIALWRIRYRLPEQAHFLDVRPIGVAIRPAHLPPHVKLANIEDVTEYVPTLWPFGPDIAAACREHGFARLARSVMPDADTLFLKDVHDRHAAHVQTMAESRIRLINLETEDPAAVRADVEAVYGLGALDRPELADLPQLRPLAIGLDGEAMPATPKISIAQPK